MTKHDPTVAVTRRPRHTATRSLTRLNAGITKHTATGNSRWRISPNPAPTSGERSHDSISSAAHGNQNHRNGALEIEPRCRATARIWNATAIATTTSVTAIDSGTAHDARLNASPAKLRSDDRARHNGPTV